MRFFTDRLGIVDDWASPLLNDDRYLFYHQTYFFMKKTLIFCAVLMCSGIIYSQSIQFGLKGGLNGSNLNFESSTDGNYKLAWHAGALAHIHLSKQIALQPEITYSEQGSKINDQGYEYDINLNYVNVPVMLQYMTGSGFRIQTGPQVGFLVHAQNEATGFEAEDKNYKNIDFSWSLGAGYKFTSGFGIDARYNHGLTDVHETITTDIHNRVFQVGVFYQFNK